MGEGEGKLEEVKGGSRDDGEEDRRWGMQIVLGEKVQGTPNRGG